MTFLKSNIKPEIKTLPEKLFVGIRTKMSSIGNMTASLWKSFMPRRGELKNRIGADLYSIEVYPPGFLDNFRPDAEFEKWAAVEVSSAGKIPQGMESITVSEGLYAVFLHKGTAAEGSNTYRYIFESWLPNCDFLLDNRPHLAVMGPKYSTNDPDSEEDLWIPVRPKIA